MRELHRAFHQHMPLWGEFVNRHGEVRRAMALEFRRRLARQSGATGLERCFPLPALRLQAPAGVFYSWYGAGRSG